MVQTRYFSSFMNLIFCNLELKQAIKDVDSIQKELDSKLKQVMKNIMLTKIVYNS